MNTPAVQDFKDHGFLPSDPPCRRLCSPTYQPWEEMISQLPALIKSGKIRNETKELPLLSTKELHHETEWRRAYVIMCFLAHGYIWASNPPAEQVLPSNIAVPLLETSNFLEVPPVATYAALALWNCRKSEPGMIQLENLTVEHTFTGTDDEAWFYIVSVAIEAQGGPIICLVASAISAMQEKRYAAANEFLWELAVQISKLSDILGKIQEKCRPDVFFHELRPFLQGSTKSAGLPRGIFYDEGHGKGSWRQLKGGSNGQSSLIQLLDIVLGVKHAPLQGKSSDAPQAESSACFFRDMREYMPGPHRRFLGQIADHPNLRELVGLSAGDEAHKELWEAYTAATQSLTELRTRHLAIVTTYIIRPSRKSERQEEKREELLGTGATVLVPFLKQARNETRQAGKEILAG
nr:indoleamine-dioxygenase [Colletotrichum truncatum]KAF6780655.1 indoleamine-dioxygenase [Colletotrichum truncatum]